MSNEIEPQLKISLFKGKGIRKVIHNDEWYFSITDIVEVLTDSTNSRRYWSDLKRKLIEDEGFAQLYEKIVQLKMESSDGKKYQTDAVNTETIFRIIQSIPSPKVEPFKRWLAKVGYERIQEIEDPELATKRMRAIYKAKGYPDDWIEMRMRGITIPRRNTEAQRTWRYREEQHRIRAFLSKTNKV